MASSATSVAVSKPRPKTTPTGYICHSLLIERIHLPKNRNISPRLLSWRSSSSSSKEPSRIERNTLMMPARMTMLSRAMRYKNVAETIVPKTPPNCSSPEPLLETAP